MNRSHSKVAIASVLLASLWFVAPAGAQKQQANEQVDPETTTRVTLGGISGEPGANVVVPIYVSPAKGVAVGRLRLEVTYVSVNMKFGKLDKGIAAELGGVDVAVEVKDGKNEKDLATQTLIITASFLSPQPPATGIPSGLLAYVTFNIGKNGRPASIGLRPTIEGTLLSGGPVPNLRAFSTQVDVLAPGTQPVLTCFFFTH
jgi:hypothetical protein